MWEVETTQAFLDWWHELSEKEQDDVTAIVEILFAFSMPLIPIAAPFF